jgi:hypothetical protein
MVMKEGLLASERAHGRCNRGLDLGQVAADLLETTEVQAQQQTLMLGQMAVERQRELIDLAPQPPLGQLGHRHGRGHTLGQRLQHEHARDTEHVAHDARELDAGALEQLERAVPLRGQRARQRLAVADQVAQHPDLGRRHEAGAHSPCRTRSAVHSASFTSVLRPGTLRMCAALPTIRVKAPSSAACTGCP